MKEIRTFYVPDALTANELPTDEAMHALRVLRMKIGDEMVLMDGQGNYYRAEVTLAHTKHCLYEIKEQMPQERQWKGHVHLAIAPTKMMDRIEWMTEKAVEIGLDELSFLNCQFSERRLGFAVRFVEEMEEPFETIIQFRYASQSDESPAIWWRLGKDKRPQEFPKELGIAAVNILLLYE